MTLSDPKVLSFLKRNFVCGWKNIQGKTAYAGKSNTHVPTNAAVQVNNCSGHHNIQMFFMTTDGRVLHCLPGYWSPKHFLFEAEFALKLARLYSKKKLSPVKRNETYLDLHLAHAYAHPPELQRSSKLQYFDKKHVENKTDDFKREKGFLTKGLKTPDQVIHERMAASPFVPFEKFNVGRFINLGRKQYKYNHGLGEGGKAKHACKCGTSCKCGSCKCK